MIFRENLGLRLVLIFAFGGSMATQAAPSPVVDTETGVVEGIRDEGVLVYRGIPFAATTAGQNRWRPPRPAKAWEGVRSATEFGPICPQNPRSDLNFDLGPPRLARLHSG